MIAKNDYPTTESDLQILRELARRKLEIAHDPVNIERRRLWYKLGEHQAERPMVLAECWVAFDDMPDAQLLCREEWARQVEHDLRFDIFRFGKIRDDQVVEPWISCPWKIEESDYGVEAVTCYADQAENANVASRQWEPPIKDIQRDFSKLHPRTFSVNREGTLAHQAHLEEVFLDILPVRIRGAFWWTMGLTWRAIDLIGLENLMLAMLADPEGLHRLMAFLRDDHLALVDWAQEEGLLTLNNENDYVGSGTCGYTHELPQEDWQPGDPVRLRDMWVLGESQETVAVGPDHFDEFVFQYQLPIIEKFGLSYYGCCEPVHNRWHVIKRIPNLRRVSISPWCDQEFMADALGRDYVFSRKPLPTLISTEHFDEDAIRKDLRETLRIAANCNLEIVMKDVHTLAGQPLRMARWVELVREEIATALA